MKTSIATVSITGPFTEKLSAIQAAGFDGIEIFEQDFIATDATPRAVGALVRDHGLEMTLFQPIRDFGGCPNPTAAAPLPGRSASSTWWPNLARIWCWSARPATRPHWGHRPRRR